MKLKTTLFLSLSLLYASVVSGQESLLYLSDYAARKVFRSELDGENYTEILSDRSVIHLTVDSRNKKLFWFDLTENKVFRSELDGSDPEVFLNNLDNCDFLGFDFLNDRLIYVTNVFDADTNRFTHTFRAVGSNLESYIELATFSPLSNEIKDFDFLVENQELHFLHFKEVDLQTRRGLTTRSLNLSDRSFAEIDINDNITTLNFNIAVLNSKQTLFGTSQRSIKRFDLVAGEVQSRSIYMAGGYSGELGPKILLNGSQERIIFSETDRFNSNAINLYQVDLLGENRERLIPAATLADISLSDLYLYEPLADADGDGTADLFDGCPADPAKTATGQCGCGVTEIDTDEDGTPNCLETCSTDPAKTAPGVCGCGIADIDSDSDATIDCNETCPTDPAKTTPGACGCGIADTDEDNNLVTDCLAENQAFKQTVAVKKKFRRVTGSTKIRKFFGVKRLQKRTSEPNDKVYARNLVRLLRATKRLKASLGNNRGNFRRFKRIILRRIDRLQTKLQAQALEQS